MAQPNSSQKEFLDGIALREMFASGMAWLEPQVEYVNSLNVFPVPDGDTGTNLLLTMRSCLAEASQPNAVAASSMATDLARGALMGARGNAGVIFSQIMRGFQEGAVGKNLLMGRDLPEVFTQAEFFSYRAVGKPVEGTMLTVVREVARCLRDADTPQLPHSLAVAAATAREWVLRTPDLLPILKQSGVVDSGAQGLAIILDGMSHYVLGDVHIPSPKMAVLLDADHHGNLPQFEGQRYGFCTEFFIEKASVDIEVLRREFEAAAFSVIVAGDRDLVKVHLHTLDPSSCLERAGALGKVGPTKIEDMDAQHRNWNRKRSSPPPTARSGVVAVASGEGLQEMLVSLGATVMQGGSTMNPSAQEILEAIMSLQLSEVIVLPNNKNVVLAARQAAEMARSKAVIVVPTASIPEGISAMVGFNYELSAGDNGKAMDHAWSRVRAGDVSWAVRPTQLGNREIALGEAIGLDHDTVVSASPDIVEALEGLLVSLGVQDGCTVTLYYGAGTTSRQAGEARNKLQTLYPKAEVQTYAGGQPHHYYLVSVD